MTVTRYKPKPGETVFGGGSGILIPFAPKPSNARPLRAAPRTRPAMQIYLKPRGDVSLIRKLARKVTGKWDLIVSGEVSQSPFHQWNCKLFARFSSDGDICVILHRKEILRELVAACVDARNTAQSEVVWTLLRELRNAGGPYVGGYHKLGRFGQSGS